VRGVKPISPWQFAVFRIVLGLYLTVHFAFLLPYGAELFSSRGVLPDPALNPTHGLFPDPLDVWGSPSFVRFFLIVLVALSVAFALGLARRTVALLLWFGWAALFNRNNLIANPSIPYVGLLLLATLLVPPGEPLAIRFGRLRERSAAWAFPASVYGVVWLLFAGGYTYSGCVKLGSPSWVDGSALRHVLANPLARPGPVRDLLLALPPPWLRLATWAALACELLPLPLSFSRRTRAWAWLATAGLQLGILAMVNFADLTFGMLMVHLFLFDPEWLPSRRVAGAQQLVLYDGVCGLCNRAVQFLLEEDRGGVLSFAPLQGETAAAVLAHREREPELRSLVFVRDRGTPRERMLVRSAGTLAILSTVGGFWRLAGVLRFVPRPLRDQAYDWIARHRYAWWGRSEACVLPAPEVRLRFLP
jgi:predicted DCC family thiol-disulfide oxidoreductase YuxK